MRTLPTVTAIATCVLLGVLSLVSFVSSSDFAYAACPSTNSADLDAPGCVVQTSDESFAFSVTASWAVPGTPFLGAVTLDDNLSVNVTSFTAIPSYFFPASCDGSQVVSILGGKDPDENDGEASCVMDLNVGPTPNNAAASAVTLVKTASCP